MREKPRLDSTKTLENPRRTRLESQQNRRTAATRSQGPEGEIPVCFLDEAPRNTKGDEEPHPDQEERREHLGRSYHIRPDRKEKTSLRNYQWKKNECAKVTKKTLPVSGGEKSEDPRSAQLKHFRLGNPTARP